jgi:hypothetical protein
VRKAELERRYVWKNPARIISKKRFFADKSCLKLGETTLFEKERYSRICAIMESDDN